MPLIMDEDMEVDMDDLFGDGAGLALPARPPPRELFERMDELRESGCCQGMAWSKWGCLASITADGRGLEFRNLRAHPRDGSWGMSEANVLPMITPALDGGPLKHLCWSSNGSDLAVIDSSGRIAILTTGNFINKPNFTRSSQMDPIDELHSIVGAHWLNILPSHIRPAIMQSYAVRAGHEYRYEVMQAVSSGPSFPNPQKAALLCVTTNGLLRLLWPQNDGKWYETTAEIESVISSEDLITHASICADKNNSLLLAFVTTSKQLRVLRVAISWGNKPVDKNQPSTTVNPSIIVRHIAVTNWMNTSSNEGSETFSYAPSMVQLSHLSILSPSPEGPGGHPTPPTIMIVRSHLPNTPSQYNQDTHSIIDRWEIVESAQSVHPAFEQLNSRRNSQVSQPGTTISLRKTEGFSLDKVVMWLESIAFDRILCFAYSDGSFEYRQRSSMAELYTLGSQDRFTHLSQVGFTYTDDEPCLQAALSPTFCSIAQKGCDNKYRWKPLGDHLGDIGTSLEDPQYATLIAAFTLTCSTAIMTSINHDDLLAVASKYNKLPNFTHDWISEVSRVLKFGFDYSEETHHDTLIRNPSVQLSLSIQNSMGYRGDANRREFGSQMAWLILQLRNCVLLMTMTFSMKVPLPDLSRKVSGLEDAEAIRKIANSVRWSLDLMCWLVDSLVFPDSQTSIYETINAVTEGNANPSIDLDALNSRLRATNNVALHILLSSAGRGFLTAVCRRIVHLDYSARKAMQTAAQIQGAPPGQASQAVISNELRASYTTIATLISVSIIPVRLLETFLTSIFTEVREAYSTAKLPYAQQQQPQARTNDLTRNVIERGILLGGPLHPVMIPVITSIFTTHLPNLRAAIDPARVFFHKYDLLGLPDDSLAGDFNQTESYATASRSREENWRVSHTIDIFQRVPIVLGQEKEEWNEAARGRCWRRCARCAAVMEDITSTKPAVQFLIMQQRRCYCGGNWDLLQGKQTVA